MRIHKHVSGLQKVAVGLSLLGLMSLTACAGTNSHGGSGAPDPSDEPPPTADSEDATHDVSGTIELPGQTLEVTEGFCRQETEETQGWRIDAKFPGGEAQFDEPHSGSIRMSEGEEWTITVQEDGPNIEVAREGVTGRSQAFLNEADQHEVVRVTLTCHYPE